MQTRGFSFLESSLVNAVVLASPDGVSSVSLGRDAEKLLSCLYVAGLSEEGHEAQQAAREIKLYLEGKLNEFNVKVDFSNGTPFQNSVWKELIKIPYGYIITYGEVARRIGNPKAAVAVGAALGQNPVPIIIPCHRVIGTNGLGGYSAGTEIKRRLLALEGIYL